MVAAASSDWRSLVCPCIDTYPAQAGRYSPAAGCENAETRDSCAGAWPVRKAAQDARRDAAAHRKAYRYSLTSPSAHALIRWWAMAIGPGTRRSGFCSLSADVTSALLNHRTSAISSLSLRISVVTALA